MEFCHCRGPADDDRDGANSITGGTPGGHIFIYSCSAKLLSFEIDCFDGLTTSI